ncbi:hypothetical protein PMIN01_04919 [Paraphaeosphaeria minitans]|uniref:Uncharacterized protein n=1 Tax=Paraphaeosphaeria minitans TaxID=565426 RepID=A0A9P6KSE1_9PLEO|nr:hypothetical protein PMIN01_04919 [Paraphaeosphaeria minitans]
MLQLYTPAQLALFAGIVRSSHPGPPTTDRPAGPL